MCKWGVYLGLPHVVKLALAGSTLGGLLHLAGVLADGVLPSLNRESLDRSYGPKVGNRNNVRRTKDLKASLADDLEVHGLFNLCRILDFHRAAPHLLFSSTSALFGSPGLSPNILGLLCAVNRPTYTSLCADCESCDMYQARQTIRPQIRCLTPWRPSGVHRTVLVAMQVGGSVGGSSRDVRTRMEATSSGEMPGRSSGDPGPRLVWRCRQTRWDARSPWASPLHERALKRGRSSDP